MTMRLAAVCRRSWNLRSVILAFFTVSAHALPKLWRNSPRGEVNTRAKDLPCFAKSLERLDDDAVHRYPTPLT